MFSKNSKRGKELLQSEATIKLSDTETLNFIAGDENRQQEVEAVNVLSQLKLASTAVDIRSYG